MKPPSVSLDEIAQLDLLYRVTVPPAYEDENGHMNVRHYLAVFDEAGYPMIERFGLTPEFHARHGTGGFDLEHHMHYLNEVRIGDDVAVYLRVVGRTSKRVHYLMFMVNETRQNLAAIFECVNSFVDLTQRRTAPYPPEIAAQIDNVLHRHRALPWEAPVCGVMSA
jgi:acyl-CoA thioester hydrolase